MQINTDVQDLVISNNHEYFKETPYGNTDWTLTVAIDATTALLAMAKAKVEAKDLGNDDQVTLSVLSVKWSVIGLVKSWSGFFGSNGEELECNDENLSKMFNDPKMSKFLGRVKDIIDLESVVIDPEDLALQDSLGKPEDTSNGITDPLAVEQA